MNSSTALLGSFKNFFGFAMVEVDVVDDDFIIDDEVMES